MTQLPPLRREIRHSWRSDGVFDIKFPRVNLLGGAVDYYSMDMDAVWRVELVHTPKAKRCRVTSDGHKETDMLRYVVGFDKNIIIPSN